MLTYECQHHATASLQGRANQGYNPEAMRIAREISSHEQRKMSGCFVHMLTCATTADNKIEPEALKFSRATNGTFYLENYEGVEVYEGQLFNIAQRRTRISQLANACVTVTVSMFSHASQNHRQCPTPYFLSQASFMVRHSLASLSLAAHCPRA